jgi:hypothetical protein
MKDSSFTREFSKWESKCDSAQKAEDAEKNSSMHHIANTNKPGKSRISKVVMSEPYTVSVDSRNREEIKYEESTVSAALVKQMLLDNAEKAKIGMNIEGPGGMNTGDFTEYNDMSFVNEYISERFNQSKDGMLKSFCQSYMDSIMKKNNTPYLGWMGIASVQKKKPIFKLVVLSILPYLWPYTIYQFVTPKFHSTYYLVLFNVNSGDIAMSTMTRVRSKLHKDQMNSHIYDFMYQISRTYEK